MKPIPNILRSELTFREMLNSGEPFRLMFPLGFVLGIVGVMLWPAFAVGAWPIYPAEAHARIMIQGFLSAFAFGFLGTAFPRLLDIQRLGMRPTVLLAIALLFPTGFHLAGFHGMGDAAFLLLLSTFLIMLLSRARKRQDIPPPGFVLVAMGMLCALFGTFLLWIDRVGDGSLPAWLFSFSRSIAWQGYMLLPILGIGAFLLPRFFGLPSKQAFPELMMPNAEWRSRALFAASCGLLIILGFLLNALGWKYFDHLIPALAISLYLYREVPLHRAKDSSGSLATGLHVALFSLPIGYALMAMFPQWQLALLHVVFITGLSLVTFIVASRVLLGHSGQSTRFKSIIAPVVGMTVLLIAALLIRIGADFAGALRFTLYGISATVWILGAVIWAAEMLPRVRFRDDE